MADRTAFLKLARDRFKQAEDADKPQRTRELEDLRFYAGEQWDADVLKSRQGQIIGSGTSSQIVPPRPSLTINKTREPVRQVLNQERQSDMAIELIPADDFGEMAGPIDHTEIELREGLVRRIQRDSEATDARTWAFARAAIAGRGYWGVMTRYVPKRSDQEVFIHRFYNQSSVLLDPAHEQPDASDIEWGFVGADVPWPRYKAEHAKRNGRPNRIVNVGESDWRALGDEAPDWFNGEGETRSVRVVDYWHTERTSVELFHLSNGSAVEKDQLGQLPPGVTVDLDPDTQEPMSHTDIKKTIKWTKIDGCDDDVLDETTWPGHYIPIIKVVGEELQPYDKERRCEGIVRPMVDPCRGNNSIVSKFVERVGYAPISPWMGPAGFDEGFEAEYDAANTRAISRLHYNQKDSFGNPAPPPFRTDARSEIQDIALGVQIFGQAIASTSVVPETALGNVDPSVKSGKLAKALIDQAERGTSNFLDNLKRSMRHEARIVNDLLYPIYGSRPGRLARMINSKNAIDAVLIGQPFTMQGEGNAAKPQPLNLPQGAPLPEGAKVYALTPNAEFNVAIKISKAEETRRQQEAQTLGEMIAASPDLMQVLGDLFFKYQDGPGHEEMSERMKAVLLPQVQATLKGGKPALPPEVQQQMQAMTEQMQQLQELADKNKTDLEKARMDADTKLKISEAELKSKERLALVQQFGQLIAVDAKLDAENARTLVEAAGERIGKELDLRLGHFDRLHEALSQHADRSHEAIQNELDRQHEKELASQTHVQTLEQTQQQADLAPAPEAEA